jgi:hypothetical protein
MGRVYLGGGDIVIRGRRRDLRNTGRVIGSKDVVEGRKRRRRRRRRKDRGESGEGRDIVGGKLG